MGHHMWCFIAPMFLVAVRAGLHDTVAQSFYEMPQSSSPAPAPTEPTPLELVGMKEIVLFLTPDQVETLQAAGAVVQPYPEYETDFAELQEQFRQSIEQQNEQSYQTNSSENPESNNAAENYYKLLNIQEINDDLSQQIQATERTTTVKTTTTPRYKYTKTRQRFKEKEYPTPYVPIKPSRTKISDQNSNSEYVRFLPNYENENLKMVPYLALPLPPYQFEDVQVNAFIRANEEAKQNAYFQAVTQAQLNAYTDMNTEIQKYVFTGAFTESTPNTYTEANTEAQQNAYSQVNEESKRNEFKPSTPTQAQVNDNTEKPQALVEVPPPKLTQKPVTAKTYLRAKDTTEFKETLSSIEGFSPPEQQQEKPQVPASPPPTVQTPTINQDKLSLLLAPLYQHQAITESIALQKEELLSTELKIQNKLQQINMSPQNYDPQEYTNELEKLTRNLGQQNALAKVEALSKSPSGYINEGSQTTEIHPIESVKSTEFPMLVRIPNPFDSRIQAPGPAEYLRQFPAEVEKRVPVSGNRNVYFKVDKPYTTRKNIPFTGQQKIPVRVPINRPEQVTVIRHIWEH